VENQIKPKHLQGQEVKGTLLRKVKVERKMKMELGGGIKESNRAGEYDQSTLYICTEIHDEIIMYNLIYASENYVSEMPKEPQQICILAI
jgi:hypothetical protein